MVEGFNGIDTPSRGDHNTGLTKKNFATRATQHEAGSKSSQESLSMLNQRKK